MAKKSTLLFTVILFSVSFVNAQIKQGSFLLGGNLSFSHYNDKYQSPGNNTSSTSAIIDLSAGKAIAENRVMGIHLTYSPMKNVSQSGIRKQLRNLYGGGVFYRKYKNLSKDFYLFLGIAGDYYFSKNEYRDSLGNSLEVDKGNYGQLSLYPGLSYEIMKHLQLEVLLANLMNLNYNVTKTSNQGQHVRTASSFSFNSSLNGGLANSLTIGFRLVF
ncbi:MAG: hypothetical protein ACTHNG_14475 [Ginsengibacter sp.]